MKRQNRPATPDLTRVAGAIGCGLGQRPHLERPIEGVDERLLDMNLLRRAVGSNDVRLATEGEIAETFSEFELGAIPPIPDLLGVTGYVDPTVLDLAEAVFADGCKTESLVANPKEVLWGEHVIVAPISRPFDLRIEGDSIDFG